MIVNDTVYVCGNIGSVSAVIEIMKEGRNPGCYFVYKTVNPKFLLHVGSFSMLMLERDDPVILGISETKQMALEIVLHIVKSMFLLEDK